MKHIIFYIMISKFEKNFSKQNKIKLKQMEKKYNKCKIIIAEINDNIFKSLKNHRYPIPTYYRILVAKLFPFLKRIIYLDGDTLTLTDLSEMYNINMENNIIMGFLDNGYNYAHYFGIKTYKYITAGVLLINIDKMKTENITYKFFEFINKNKKLLIQHDQTVINIVLNGKIGLLPPKYGIWSFSNITELLLHNYYNNYSINLKCYNDNELINAWKFPGIIHYVLNKPYLFDNYKLNNSFIKLWLHYAKKTEEYNNIIKYYNFLF